jgi:hypothetical protein
MKQFLSLLNDDIIDIENYNVIPIESYRHIIDFSNMNKKHYIFVFLINEHFTGAIISNNYSV